VPWIRDAVAAEEPILVVVAAGKIARLRGELGADAEHVAFADMADVGANPARIIPAWCEFVDAHPGRGRRLRGIGEPVSAQRSADELVECQRHEALLNLAFAGAEDFWLLCPYDVDTLDPDVIAKAHHSHPTLVADGVHRGSATYEGLDTVAGPFAEPLPAPPADADELAFAAGTLAAVRRLVRRRARDAGLAGERAGDLVLAVNEVATNSIRHGGGRGVLRTWKGDGALVCEVADAGRIADPLAGRQRPAGGQSGGHGLWLCNQVCDLVQLRAFASGSVVRMHMRLGT
jgi:anti-sigma regulatory factor (Ser/Thr protein kinase)